MPEQKQESVQGHGELRSFNAGTVYVHYDHVQAGIRKAVTCGLCRQGLGSVLATIAPSVPPDE